MPEESIAALEQRRAHLCRQLASIGEGGRVFFAI